MIEKVIKLITEKTNFPENSIYVEFKGIEKNKEFTWLEHLILFGWSPRVWRLEQRENLNIYEKQWLTELKEALKKAEKLSKRTNIFFFKINHKEEKFIGWATEEEVLINTKIENEH